jgi:hypothetical protein
MSSKCCRIRWAISRGTLRRVLSALLVNKIVYTGMDLSVP